MDRQGRGLSANALKGIAAAAMFLDHLALLVLYPLYQQSCMVDGIDLLGDAMPAEARRWYLLYLILRSAGRLTFPIFAYLLVEGFRHTRDWRRYARRLFWFALISEAAYDYPWSLESLESQNVLWTLLIGLLLLHRLEEDEKREEWERRSLFLRDTLFAMLAAALMGTDYSFCGVLLIAVFYLYREDFRMQIRYGSLVLLALTVLAVLSERTMGIQIFGLLSFVLLYFYDGRRGRGGTYFFYLFYPVHLLILGIVGRLL